MTKEEFNNSLVYHSVPKELSASLQALWYDAKGQWHKAHALIDHLEDRESAHVHAYLHRAEGDVWNARYWYNRAQEQEFDGTLEEEWTYLVNRYLVSK